MKSFVTNFPPALEQILGEFISIEQLWNEGKYLQAEVDCERQYRVIKQYEERCPPNTRFHKGATLYNWGISILNQNVLPKKQSGIIKIILAYIEDLMDYDSIQDAIKAPAALTLRQNFPETAGLMNKLIEVVTESIRKGSIEKNPEIILGKIVNVDKIIQNEISIGSQDKPDNIELAKSKVFVIHGRNQIAHSSICAFLISIGLEPLEWGTLIEACGTTTPHITDIIDAGFRLAQAVVVLLTPDDEGRLREELWGKNESEDEKHFKFRPRQNVLFEAGMAMSSHRRRTILIELGKIHIPSDILGIFTVRLDDSKEKREDLIRRLIMSECSVNLDGVEWETAGDFSIEAIESYKC